MYHDPTAEGKRAPTAEERALLARLLSAGGEGFEGLRCQLEHTMVESLDADGGLRLYPESASPAQVPRRIPVEASYPDSDGVMVHVLLHVLDGFVNELEVFREDSLPVQRAALSVPDVEVEVWPS
jgi:Domain of unknown function (DUF6984)